MSFAASIMARLGLDTAGFRSELKSAEAVANGAHGNMAGAAGRNTVAHENLLASNHRVARQMQNFSRDVLSGADATTVLSSGLEGLERALRLPLGALAGLGIAAVAIVKLTGVVAEYKKLNEEVEKLNSARVSAPFTTLDQIKQHADEATKKIDELQKKISFWKNFTGDAKLNIERSLEDTQKGRAQDQTDEFLKARTKNDLHDQPDFIGKAVKIQEQFLEVVQRLGQRGVTELERELENLAKDVARTRRERAQGSLDEIAARPDKIDNGTNGPNAWLEGVQAREAKHEEELAKQARDQIGGSAGLDEAQKHLNRADQIKGGIESLKDSEKDLTGAFRGALDSARVLQEIREALKALNFGMR